MICILVERVVQRVVDALVALVVVDDDIDGVGLLPVYVVLIVSVLVVENALVLNHERFDEGVGHGVGLRLECVLVGFRHFCIERSDGARLGIGSRRSRQEEQEQK